MKHAHPKVLSLNLFATETGVVEHCLIGIERFSRGSQDDDLLGDGIDDPPNLMLVSLMPLFRSLEVLNIRIRSIPSNDGALLVSDRHGAK